MVLTAFGILFDAPQTVYCNFGAGDGRRLTTLLSSYEPHTIEGYAAKAGVPPV